MQTDVVYKDYETSAACCVRNDAVSAKADETQSHMEAVAVPETLNLAQ